MSLIHMLKCLGKYPVFNHIISFTIFPFPFPCKKMVIPVICDILIPNWKKGDIIKFVQDYYYHCNPNLELQF